MKPLQILRHRRFGEFLVQRRFFERFSQLERVIDALDVALEPGAADVCGGERHETRHEAERQLPVLQVIEGVDGLEHDLGATCRREALGRLLIGPLARRLVEHAHGDAEEGAVDELVAALDARRHDGVVQECLDDAVANRQRSTGEHRYVRVIAINIKRENCTYDCATFCFVFVNINVGIGHVHVHACHCSNISVSKRVSIKFISCADVCCSRAGVRMLPTW